MTRWGCSTGSSRWLQYWWSRVFAIWLLCHSSLIMLSSILPGMLSSHWRHILLVNRGVIVWSMLKVPDDVCRSDFGLLRLWYRGGLIRPAANVMAVCKCAEHHNRHFTGPRHKPLIGTNVRARIQHRVLTEFIGHNIFESLAEHSLGMEPMSNHRVEMIWAIANKYITLRLHHQCKLHTRSVQGATCRSICTKTVQFKRQ